MRSSKAERSNSNPRIRPVGDTLFFADFACGLGHVHCGAPWAASRVTNPALIIERILERWVPPNTRADGVLIADEP
jgi:hypothetical protein